jgi:hypothetical protein
VIFLNKKELEERLIKEEIRTDLYSLNGGLPSEVYCLSEINGVWEVYYSERGSKTGLQIFDDEGEACQYFYEELIRILKNMRLI